uniref:Uncharacterized protein n=1 Tax=Anguilla anguilla TaxID=7936 RepID=A0A0E9SXG7_ANGAN
MKDPSTMTANRPIHLTGYNGIFTKLFALQAMTSA